MKLKEIRDLQQVVKTKLSKLITEDYVLLDLPNHKNIGDQLIYKGELDFLEDLSYKCISSSSNTFSFDRDIKANTILLHGGGNFGDLYSLHQNYREKIIEEYPTKKIIIFPQSVHFDSEKEVKRSSDIFNNHGNVTICARDQFSYDFLTQYFSNCNILMLPDMAFCSSYKRTLNPTEEILIMKRLDFEINELDETNLKHNYPEIDWLTFEESPKESIISIYEKINNRISKIWYKAFNKSSVFGLLPIRNEEKYIKNGVDFLSKYKFVITTRLHGHILSLLLGIPSIIVNNSYGKNKRFYETWLQDIPNSYYADSIDRAIYQYKQLKDDN